MKPGALIVVAAAAVASVACGVQADGPPHIEVDRTPCAHCGMLVSEPVYAAAYRTAGSTPRVFDDIGCLLEEARREARPDALHFWFHDAAGGTWIDGKDALFVAASSLATPMGGGVIAFRDAAAARDSAVQHQGRVVRSLADLLGPAATSKEGGS
jgi:copper chaperone NosL